MKSNFPRLLVATPKSDVFDVPVASGKMSSDISKNKKKYFFIPNLLLFDESTIKYHLGASWDYSQLDKHKNLC